MEDGICRAHEGLDEKMNKENPTGTGSFSLNRKEGTTVGEYSTAEGLENIASKSCSHAEGRNTKSNGYNSHTEGTRTEANGYNAHAEGDNTRANGDESHAEGVGTEVNGYGAHVEGVGTIASGAHQHVQGRYNEEDTEGQYAHIVGGGDSEIVDVDGGVQVQRKNIHTLDWLGNAVFAGDITNGNGVSMDGLRALIDELAEKVQTLTEQLQATSN